MNQTIGPDNNDRGYDPNRVHVRPVLWFVVGFIVSIGVMFLIVSWMRNALTRHMEGQAVDLPTKITMPQPLQPSPGHPALAWQDMAELRGAQQHQLNSYGLAGAGRAHIPINRAFERLLQSGKLNQPWKNLSTQPYQLDISPNPRIKPSVENRS